MIPNRHHPYLYNCQYFSVFHFSTDISDFITLFTSNLFLCFCKSFTHSFQKPIFMHVAVFYKFWHLNALTYYVSNDQISLCDIDQLLWLVSYFETLKIKVSWLLLFLTIFFVKLNSNGIYLNIYPFMIQMQRLHFRNK